jgi:hypothetical protein
MSKRASSKELLGEMADGVAMMGNMLRDPDLSAEVQISDINMLCWRMVGLAQKLQQAVFVELRGTE